MKDVRLSVKVRNNLLLSAIEKAGFTSMPKFCKEMGAPYPHFMKIINMTSSPIRSNGELYPWIINICVKLNKTPNDLFNTDQLYHVLDTNRSEIEVSMDEIHGLLSYDTCVEDEQTTAYLEKFIDDNLSFRQAHVIKSRFGINCEHLTLEDCSDSLNVSRERVRQMESKSLRHLSKKATDGSSNLTESVK